MKITRPLTLVALGLLSTLPAQAGEALIRITCFEEATGSEIYINGKFKGECPLDVGVQEGQQKVRVVKKVDANFERVFEQEVRMGDGAVKKLEVKLGESQLTTEGKKRVQAGDAKLIEAVKKQSAADEAAKADAAQERKAREEAARGWATEDNGADINWNDAKAYCAGKGSGWRLPTVTELQDSYKTGQPTPCGDRDVRDTCKVASNSRLTGYFYWSNESPAYLSSSVAWGVSLYDGGRSELHVRGGSATRALCVRRT